MDKRQFLTGAAMIAASPALVQQSKAQPQMQKPGTDESGPHPGQHPGQADPAPQGAHHATVPDAALLAQCHHGGSAGPGLLDPAAASRQGGGNRLAAGPQGQSAAQRGDRVRGLQRHGGGQRLCLERRQWRIGAQSARPAGGRRVPDRHGWQDHQSSPNSIRRRRTMAVPVTAWLGKIQRAGGCGFSPTGWSLWCG